MIGAPNLRNPGSNGTLTNGSRAFQCHPEGESEATITLTLVGLGIVANTVLMALIIFNKHLRRWSQGLLFHQAMVDCARAAILIPLAHSLLYCVPVKKCSLVETAFLLLVTVSTINMLTIVLNDSPVFPEDDEEDGYQVSSVPLLLDSPQCVVFGTFMIWFAAITINLGPTFMSGALAAGAEVTRNKPGCPLVHGPFRHYILNALWIIINLLCVLLTLFHLRKLHRDLTKANVEAVRVAGLVTTLVNVTGNNYSDPRHAPRRSLGAVEEHQRMRNYLLRIEREGVQKVKMFVVITAAYVIFWGPLFFVTLVQHPLSGNRSDYEYAQVLLMCARGAEPKIVYSRPPRNDTDMTVQTAEADDDEMTTTNTTTTAALATLASTGHRYADSSKSMSSRANNYYGVQYYAPPVVHGTAADAFTRQLHMQQQHHQRHALQQPATVAAATAYHQRGSDRPPWEQTPPVVHANGGPILMNPLQLQPTAYDDPSTARYAPPKPHRAQPVARIIKYAEPAAAAVAYQLPYLAAEADDRTLLDNLPALQFALQHATGKTQPSSLVSSSGHQQYAALQQPPNHQYRHHQVKQTPATAMHQVYPLPPHQHLHRHHQRLLQPHPVHHAHLQHRYAPYGAAQPATRYTQVPFLYNLPAPPTAQRHLLAPAEYDLVTRFNRLLKQRERDDRHRVQESARRRRPDDGDISGGAVVVDDIEDGEEEETTTRPAVKAKKAKKKRKKKPTRSTTPAPPAPVEEELDEDDGDRRPPPSRRHKQLVRQDDERADDEQPNSEEQESQNVHTSEKLPEGTIVQETEDELQHTLDEPSQLSEQFGGDLTFEDSDGERVEFQLHGISGPDSYKFGFDTGKGSNRQFRYEERDNGGNVHGHYGYLDNDGKMQVYNYSSHPELGYHAQKAEALEV